MFAPGQNHKRHLRQTFCTNPTSDDPTKREYDDGDGVMIPSLNQGNASSLNFEGIVGLHRGKVRYLVGAANIHKIRPRPTPEDNKFQKKIILMKYDVIPF